MKYMRKGAQKNEKKKAMGGYGKIKRKGGTKAEAGKDKSSFGMLSVKAGIDNNPKPTAADRIAGAEKGKKAMAGKPKDKPKMSENEVRFRRRKAQGAGNAAERVSNLKQKKAEAEDKGKTKKASRVQKRVERTTKRGQRRSAAATAGRTSEELKSIGIQPSKEVSFNKPAPKRLPGSGGSARMKEAGKMMKDQPKARYGMAKAKKKKK